MVLAAGYGTRLAPLTEEIPKPLLPVGDRSLLLTALERLREAGARSLSVNGHHLSAKISSIIENMSINVHVFCEEKILGTAGGIRAAAPSFVAPQVLVVNGDMFGPLPIEPLLAHEGRESIVMAVCKRPPFEGTVGLGEDGRVVRLRGEVFGSEVAGADYVGVARLADRCWEGFPTEGCLVGDVLLPALRRGEPVGATLVESELTDVGTLHGYVSANRAWLRERTPAGGSWLGARVRGAESRRLVDSILGEGVEVRGEGALERVIALPGAKFSAPLADSIVMPSGRVVGTGSGP